MLYHLFGGGRKYYSKQGAEMMRGQKRPRENESEEPGACGCPAEALARGHPNPPRFAPEVFRQPAVAGRGISTAVLDRNVSFCLHPTPERELQLEKTNHSISAREGEEVTLRCLLQGARQPTTHLSATWFREEEESRRVRPLLTLHRDGAIEYQRESLSGRLHLRRPAAGDFGLTLHRVEKGDAGVYHCQVQEWQQQGEGKGWVLQASANSGYTQLATVPPGNAAECEGLLTPHRFPLSRAGVCGEDNGSSLLLAMLAATARMQQGWEGLLKDCRGGQCWGDCQSCVGSWGGRGSPLRDTVLWAW